MSTFREINGCRWPTGQSDIILAKYFHKRANKQGWETKEARPTQASVATRPQRNLGQENSDQDLVGFSFTKRTHAPNESTICA